MFPSAGRGYSPSLEIVVMSNTVDIFAERPVSFLGKWCSHPAYFVSRIWCRWIYSCPGRVPTFAAQCFSHLILMGCGPSDTTTDPRYQRRVQDIGLTEIFRVGDQEGDVALFGEVSDIDVNSRGEIFVIDSREKSVYAFTEEGRRMGAIGRDGAGPGEFAGPISVHITQGDSLYVFDRMLMRVSVFDPSTFTVIRVFSVSDNFSRGSPSTLLGISEQGVLVKYITPFYPGMPDGPRYDRVYLMDYQGNISSDPILRVLARDFITTTSGGGISARPLPFGRASVVRYSPYNGRLYAGRNNSIEINLISIADGSTVKSFQLAIPNMSITDFDRDSILSRATSEIVRQRLISAEWPSSHPAFETFLVSDDGLIWLKRTMPSPSVNAEWLIIGKTGQLSAITYLPKDVVLEVIKRNKAYGHGTDLSTGAPYLVSYVVK